jgi:hypothetical protein
MRHWSTDQHFRAWIFHRFRLNSGVQSFQLMIFSFSKIREQRWFDILDHSQQMLFLAVLILSVRTVFLLVNHYPRFHVNLILNWNALNPKHLSGRRLLQFWFHHRFLSLPAMRRPPPPMQALPADTATCASSILPTASAQCGRLGTILSIEIIVLIFFKFFERKCRSEATLGSNKTKLFGSTEKCDRYVIVHLSWNKLPRRTNGRNNSARPS